MATTQRDSNNNSNSNSASKDSRGKADNSNSKTTKSRKRSDSDEKEWNWSDTLLKDEDTSLKADDIKQLLITRGEEKKNLHGKKADLIRFLKERYDVGLREPIDDLTCKELVTELKLRGLDDSSARKEILAQRLKGEIDATLPALKKARRAAKKSKLPKVFVTVYTPPAGAEDENTEVLGVFRTERNAYKKAYLRLLADLDEKLNESKGGDSSEESKEKETQEKEKQQNVREEFDKELQRVSEKDYEKKLQLLAEAMDRAYGSGKEDDAPFCVVSTSSLGS